MARSAVGPVRAAWLVAVTCLAVLCLMFSAEIGAAVATWNASTAYGHCWLVLPIVGWLLWERRLVLARGVPAPWFWPVLAALPCALVWIAADVLGIMEGRQLAFVGFAELLLLAALGLRLWWALSAAFLYLVFLVPFGAFITPVLQHFTTAFILGGLRVLDVPFEANAFTITIPEGQFYVAEACAGLRFLIAAVAFGVLYAVTMFRSPWRRAAFIAVSCVVPVVANGFRGLGIVMLGHWLGSAEAGVADHIIYGWVFFSFVIVMLALAGLPFRQDVALGAAGPVRAGPPVRPVSVLVACLPVLIVAFAAPFGAGLLEHRGAAVAARVPRMDLPAGCTAGLPTIAGAVSLEQVHCRGAVFELQATALPAGANPSRVLDAARAPATVFLAGADDIDTTVVRLGSGAQWVVLAARDSGRRGAYTVLRGRHLVAGGLADRLAMAGDMLRGTGNPPLAVSVTIASSPDDVDTQLADFLNQAVLF